MRRFGRETAETSIYSPGRARQIFAGRHRMPLHTDPMRPYRPDEEGARQGPSIFGEDFESETRTSRGLGVVIWPVAAPPGAYAAATAAPAVCRRRAQTPTRPAH